MICKIIKRHYSFREFLAPINTLCLVKYSGDRAIAQAVSRRLPTAAARVQTRVWSCGFLWWTKVEEAGFLRELRFPLPIYIPSESPQSSSLSPEAGKIGQDWPQCQQPHKPNKKKVQQSLITVKPRCTHSSLCFEDSSGACLLGSQQTPLLIPFLSDKLLYIAWRHTILLRRYWSVGW
jgi:hypothetical protein